MMEIQAAGDDSYARFERWRNRIEAGNPNLPLICLELDNYGSGQFAEWMERGLTRIYNERTYPSLAFSPGEMILGGNSSIAWQDELLVIISRLTDSACGAAVRGIVDIFKAIPPEANHGPNHERKSAQEKKILELLRIVRSLRAPLCSAWDANPLSSLRRLLTVQYPSNPRVFREALLTWYAFSYQCDPDSAQQWRDLFESSSCFRSEHVPLVAFGLARGTPRQINDATIYWGKFAKYMRSMANGIPESEDARKTMQRYYAALIKLHRETQFKSNSDEADKEFLKLTGRSYFKVAALSGDIASSEISRAAECAEDYSIPLNVLFLKPEIRLRKQAGARQEINMQEIDRYVAA